MEPEGGSPGDRGGSILIFAPHPDDETLGCAGVIMKAVRAGRRLRVVFVTNGDGFARAAAFLSGKDAAAVEAEDFLAVARVRQQGAFEAARILGISADALVFLGYPDGGLARMPADGSIPFVHACTRKSRTYGLLVPDYRSRTRGEPAPYLRSAVLADIAELIDAVRPGEIYVTDPADGHSDHRECCALVREAAAGTGFRGEIFTYLVHSSDGGWPTPRGADPDAPFETAIVSGRRSPADVPWPPPDRRPMSREDSTAKLRAIRAYSLETRLAGGYVESFVKSEEVFWRLR
ncbi:MAG: PIG-L family deacetylase [Planctomycetota bacterium]|nr:PIG-L family deacetylase [Planctomycetota bacterium]